MLGQHPVAHCPRRLPYCPDETITPSEYRSRLRFQERSTVQLIAVEQKSRYSPFATSEQEGIRRCARRSTQLSTQRPSTMSRARRIRYSSPSKWFQAISASVGPCAVTRGQDVGYLIVRQLLGEVSKESPRIEAPVKISSSSPSSPAQATSQEPSSKTAPHRGQVGARPGVPDASVMGCTPGDAEPVTRVHIE